MYDLNKINKEELLAVSLRMATTLKGILKDANEAGSDAEDIAARLGEYRALFKDDEPSGLRADLQPLTTNSLLIIQSSDMMTPDELQMLCECLPQGIQPLWARHGAIELHNMDLELMADLGWQRIEEVAA